MKTIEEKLERLVELYETGMITQSEYLEETIMLIYAKRAQKLVER